ncbi:class I SAM-dependent methyltransferase [Nocardia takedensis]
MTTSDTTTGVDTGVGTRPGTPMIGPYSTNQMDDFYAAFARGEFKATGVMNALQRLFITERITAGDRVVDVCCGRGLQLAPLFRYVPDLGGYTGLDISPANLGEARARVAELREFYPQAQIPVELLEVDVSAPWPTREPFDVAVYTSAFEHLPRALAIASVERTLAALAPAGVLYLSTPNTVGGGLQHRVHVYEWAHDELTAVLGELGAEVREVVGILPPQQGEQATAAAVRQRFGSGALEFYRHMADNVPAALLGPVVSTALDDAASEILYVITPGPR